MAAKSRILAIMAVLGTATFWPMHVAWGQSSPLGPPPAANVPGPIVQPGTTPAPTLGPPTPVQDPAPFPPPPGPSPLAAPNGATPYDLPPMPSQIFANIDIDILKPHLKAALTNTVTFPDGSQTVVQPPMTQVGWTAAPRFEVGYFLPDPNLGLFAFSYRGFATDGRQDVTSLDGAAFSLRTRLDLNQIAFDYGTTPYSFAPHWDVSGRLGVALADVFFDNRAVNAIQTLYASNNFLGAGPHLRADLNHHIGLLPGLDFFGRADFLVLVGQIHQRFLENDLNLDGSTTEGQLVQRKTSTVPVLTLQAGLSYTPPSYSTLHFAVGYQFEDWWFVGQGDGVTSRGQFSTNGVFLRAAVDF